MSWQELIRVRLQERDARESSHKDIITHYQRLAAQTRLLKERNQSLLRAVGSVGGGTAGPSASTVVVGGEDNPVRAAYIVSLESQITSLRDEMAAVYKTQGQNAQRLLAMNETLREKEEAARTDSDDLRKSRDELTVLRRKVKEHNELMSEKDRSFQILYDELAALQLELNQADGRADSLKSDNAMLLQRWLDHMGSAVNTMNEANEFYEGMKTRWHTQQDNHATSAPTAIPGGGRPQGGDAGSDTMSLGSTGSFVSGSGTPGYDARTGLGFRDGAGVTAGAGGALRLNPNG